MLDVVEEKGASTASCRSVLKFSAVADIDSCASQFWLPKECSSLFIIDPGVWRRCLRIYYEIHTVTYYPLPDV